MNAPKTGLAGRLATAFLSSRITPVLMLAAFLLGFFALAKLPREEEPQIHVPMFDVFVPFPGASPAEVEERIIRLGERKFWEIPDVEYIYSTAEPGMAMFILRFKVGTTPETAMTRVYTKTFANADLVPLGALPPIIKPRSIDDVPIVALTVTGSDDGRVLRKAGAAIRDEVSAIPDVSITEVIGGERRQFHILVKPEALAARQLTLGAIERLLQASNVRMPAGTTDGTKERMVVETDSYVHSATDLGEIVIGVSAGRPVQLKDVADVVDGPDEDDQAVLHDGRPAVTIAVSKRPRANATDVAHRVIATAKTTLARENPALDLEITRNLGDTAREKSDELLYHLFLATISVTLLIALVLGFREGIVVLLAIPVTLSLTLLLYYLFGYTLNRITLFALIFSIGILVDDAIVVVENIHRHWKENPSRPLNEIAVRAVDEVGNPTILATWAVIAAILPMAFVGGLMGPYMRPIPVGASVAMLFSLAVAFIISPWAFVRLLKKWPPKQGKAGHEEGALDRAYRRMMRPILTRASVRWAYFAALVILPAAAVALIFTKSVVVKMLPFDNKDEFEIVLNLPERATFAQTRAAADEAAEKLKQIPEVAHTVSYLGTASPYNFNGLVRHYFLRQRPHQAQVQAILKPRHERRRQSHAIAQEARRLLADLPAQHNARLQVAEVPPGPPVLSTIVIEVYGPSQDEREKIAAAVTDLLRRTDGITDVDYYMSDPQPKTTFVVDRVKTSLNGIAPVEVADTVATAMAGKTVGLAHVEDEREPVEIRLRLPAGRRENLATVRSLELLSRNGRQIPVSGLASEMTGDEHNPIYRKNLLPATYVIADVSGRLESPVYAITNLREPVEELAAKVAGRPVKTYYARLPGDAEERAIKWDGEWHVTYEVFRDLGIAFALVLVLMYILVVYWFESFTVPIVIMTPIPLTLVGILPAHWLSGAFFTATSMIGFIAGAGIVVRNSIILVDFINLRLKEGASLEDAVVDAGAIRFRPMLLTAAAVAVGAGVILFDPIFQGLAISLIAGEAASTVLSRTAVPVLFHVFGKRGWIALPDKEA